MKGYAAMDKNDFERFVLDNGKDILRFCIMTAGDKESGCELYQNTMLKLMEKLTKLDPEQNVKSYAMSVSILLWKNKKKKYSVRKRIAPMRSLDELSESTGPPEAASYEHSPERIVLGRIEREHVRVLTAALPEKYRLPVYLAYSANMKTADIAKCLHIPVSTVKTRMRKAKQILKAQLEAEGYDG